MKIYELYVYDTDQRWYFEPTLKAALELKKQIEAGHAEHVAENDLNGCDIRVEIKPIEIEPTRKGIANELQSLIDRLCVNEH